MNSSFLPLLLACLTATIISYTDAAAAPSPDPDPSPAPKRIVNVGVGQFCSLGAAPVGPGGSWQVVEKDVEKVCAPGTECRKGACNCNDLPDGSVMGLATDSQGNHVCRKIAGQKCAADGECFEGVQCKQGICTCDKNKNEYCVDYKNDVIILA